MKVEEGNSCIVTNDGGLFAIEESSEFIGNDCIVIKKTRAGLIQVALKENLKRVYSVPERNINLTCDDCGKSTPDVSNETCPYYAEIDKEQCPCTLCDSCYDKRGDGI